MDGLPPHLREPEASPLDEVESELARLRWQRLRRWQRAQRGLEAALIFPVAAGVFLLATVQGSLREGIPVAGRVWDPQRPGDASLLLYPLGLLAGLLGAYVLVRLRVGAELGALGRLGVNPARALMALEQPQRSEQRLRWQEKLLRKPWWLVEISGAHLIWWLTFALMAWWGVHSARPPDPLSWSPSAACDVICKAWGPVCAVGGIGFMLKLWAPFMLWLRADRRELALYYRWWSGWTWPVAIALSPGLVHLLLTALGVKMM